MWSFAVILTLSSCRCPPIYKGTDDITRLHGCRIELSLKSKGWATLEDFTEGQIVRGRVRRAEKFGVFVRIDDSAVTGMAHISEVADERVDDLPAMFKPGQGAGSF